MVVYDLEFASSEEDCLHIKTRGRRNWKRTVKRSLVAGLVAGLAVGTNQSFQTYARGFNGYWFTRFKIPVWDVSIQNGKFSLRGDYKLDSHELYFGNSEIGLRGNRITGVSNLPFVGCKFITLSTYNYKIKL